MCTRTCGLDLYTQVISARNRMKVLMSDLPRSSEK